MDPERCFQQQGDDLLMDAFRRATSFFSVDFLPVVKSSSVLDVLCSGCDVDCEGCITSPGTLACTEELEHTKSGGGNITIEALEIDPGYWRATNTSTKVLAC